MKPEELEQRIDYLKEKERLLVQHASELEEQVREKEEEISERHKAEEALEAEKERLAVTLRSIGDGVITTDTDKRIMLMNPVAEMLTGWELKDALGKPLERIFRIQDERTGERMEKIPIKEVFSARRVVNIHGNITLEARAGDVRAISSSAAPILERGDKVLGAVLVFRDITEKRRMQEDLLKVRKLESIGVLAGGIAHDFNNLLTGILNHLYLGKMVVSPDDEVFQSLEETEKAALRAQALTQQLLTFSKGGAPVKKTASIGQLVEDCTQFALRGSNVKPDIRIQENLRLVEVDEGQISQVIQNLVINGAQAMPDGGILTVRADNVTVDSPIDPNFEAGPYVMLTVQDHGYGISKENLSKIFDPYFTTKDTGQGLGLFSAYSIIEKHGGHIRVSSEVDKGTRFTIHLPVSSQEELPSYEMQDNLEKVTGKILVMDDEDVIRDAATRYLSMIGFDAECACNGEEALALYEDRRNAGQPFDLVIMDLTIPGGMGGRETMEKLHAIDPDVKAIVASGYSNDPVMADYKEYGFAGVLTKPYKVDDLSLEIRKALQEESLDPDPT